MKKSVWTENAKLPGRKRLEGDAKTDVLIIGGGMCGVLCAWFLQQRGIDCILAEGNKTASGITKNTTAKITSQHALIYDTLIKRFGFDKAQMYLAANEDAVKEYENISRSVNCGFERKKAYTYSMSDREKIENEVKAVNSLGFQCELTEDLELPFKTAGAVCFENQAQFHPLEFIQKISRDLNIYEDTFIRELTPLYAVYERGRIKCEQIIVCTHFPFINKHGGYFLKLYQERSYISAFSNAQTLDGMYVDENSGGFSFSSYDDLLLIGGGSHRTGKKGGAWKKVNDFALRYYPDAKIKYEWAAQDCMSLDSVPYIGQYSKNTPFLYVATGFNKWGMTSSMAAAKILADMAEGKRSDYSEVFSPQRSILRPQLFVNGFEAAINLLTPTLKRCPHLGCALKWNKWEHTWDCPCHGSRFEENGALIDNPSTGDFNKD